MSEDLIITKKLIDDYLIPALQHEMDRKLQGIRDRFVKIEKRLKELERRDYKILKEIRYKYVVEDKNGK